MEKSTARKEAASSAYNEHDHKPLNTVPDSAPMFPWESVVGIIDELNAVDAALHELLAAGFDESGIVVLAGDKGVQLIESSGNDGVLGRVFRKLSAIGAESEHTERHAREVEKGNFVIVVPSEGGSDEVERISAILSAHGAHFVNYYTRWTTRGLVP
jgi:hypothetical protein